MDALLARARDDKLRLAALRREFHRHPETALQEYETAKRIERELDALGVEHKRVGETGVLGVLRGADEGKRIVALRADIDALPIREETDAPYRSEVEGVMHACGHDAHTACLLGAARLLCERKNEFGGEIRLLFQPAEETGGGAEDFISAGALDGVQRVFGLHVAPDLPVGTVGVRAGANNAAVDHFRVSVYGKSAHVARPQLGADALHAASQLVVALQGLVSRRTSPTEPVIVGVGKLSAGTAYNAVAEYAELEGTTRTVSQETRFTLRRRIDEAAHCVSTLSGAVARVEWTGVCSAIVNDPAACGAVRDTARSLGLTVTEDRPLSMAGDNFAEYLLKVPGCYAYLGTANEALPDTLAGIHNGCFDLDEDALPLGAALYAACALRWLNE